MNVERRRELFEELCRELIRAIRAGESRQDLSARLGYGYNQVAKWETGSKRILWSDFIAIVRAKSLAIESALREAQVFNFEDPTNAPVILGELQGTLSVTEFAKRVNKNRLKLTRWLAGSTDVPLADLLEILHEIRNNVMTFLGALVPLEHLPTARELFVSTKELDQFIKQYPWVTLVLRLLAHPDCPGRSEAPNFIARQTGLKRESIRDAIRLLENNGMISEDEAGCLVPKMRRYVPPKSVADVAKVYWTGVGEQVMKRGLDNENFAAFMVLSASDESWEKITHHYRNFFEGLRQIIDADEGRQKKFKLINVHLLDMENIGLKADLA